MLPIAFLFSKWLKTNWKIKENPLQPFGLWLNFAQLYYFPFLIFVMIRMPEYYIMTYAIITGGHLFPYAWFYKTKWYAIFAGIIVLGTLFLGLSLPNEKMYFVALFTGITLFLLTICLYFDNLKKRSNWSIKNKYYTCLHEGLIGKNPEILLLITNRLFLFRMHSA